VKSALDTHTHTHSGLESANSDKWRLDSEISTYGMPIKLEGQD